VWEQLPATNIDEAIATDLNPHNPVHTLTVVYLKSSFKEMRPEKWQPFMLASGYPSRTR
jgi:hypothetical protein